MFLNDNYTNFTYYNPSCCYLSLFVAWILSQVDGIRPLSQYLGTGGKFGMSWSAERFHCEQSSQDSVYVFGIVDKIVKMFKLLFQLLCFTAARTNGGSIQYLVSWKDGFAATVFESDEVKQKWPVLFLNFLESRLHIFIPTNPTLNVVTFPLTESNVTGDPKVVHCKFFFDNFQL